MQQEIIENDDCAWEKELDAKTRQESGIKSKKEKEGSKTEI